MRIGSYLHQGRQSYGVFTEDGIVDLGRRLGETAPTLLCLLREDALDRAREAAADAPADFAARDVTFLPPVTEPVNIFCAGRNYKDHLAELNAEPPAFPTLFMKLFPSLVGHGEALIKPSISDAYDFEAELCAVIGRRAHKVGVATALDHVAGYTCLMDGSVRDFQQRSTDQGKNFYRASAIGPWIVTADSVPPPEDMRIEGKLNGQAMQSSTIDQLLFTVADLVAYYSAITVLEPGDMIATGTCGGVGHARTPPVYLKDGDVFEVIISGIGTLRNAVTAEE